MPPLGKAQTLADTYFLVAIPGVDAIGLFYECTGLEISFEVLEYREGGNNDFVHRLPGRVQYPNLVLSRGVTKDETLQKWFWATHTEADRKEITVTLNSSDAAAQRTWTFADDFPVRWTGPTLSADGTRIATESLEIVHTGLKMA
jgi:phage tail-like protein